MGKVKIGVIGCGNISSIYLKNLTEVFKITEVSACADLFPENAKKQADEFKVPKACTVDELLSDSEIKIVVNLTNPDAHADVNLAALDAGKNIYVEKPLAVNREDGKKVIDKAEEKGLLAGGAPDTFLGGGLQTCRKLIDDGWIGRPVGATAFMMCHGHEGWHPSPEFYYKAGGGPMFDMGPYYLTALVSLIGPVSRVTGSARKTFDKRTITSQPKYGKDIEVEVPTHVTGILDFENGAVGTIITSFDVWHSKLPYIEIYGSEGGLLVPDPNTFGGHVLVQRYDTYEWKEVPLTHGYIENSRGLGVADMASALVCGRKHRAHGDMTYHVLDIMQGIHDASVQGKHYDVKSTCVQPKAMPLGLLNGEIDR